MKEETWCQMCGTTTPVYCEECRAALSHAPDPRDAEIARLRAACQAALEDELKSRRHGAYITDGTMAILRAALQQGEGGA